ncbi:MAG: flagellar biosynthesis protein FlhB [Magnetococcus sp. DMHC-6]
MSDDTDQESKTEDPTGKRMDDARSKGQLAQSKEVSTAFLFLAATGYFYFQGDQLWNAIQGKFRFLLSGMILDDLTPLGTSALINDLVQNALLDLAPFFIFLILAALFASFLQNGFVFTFETLTPKLSKLNPLEGFSRLFSTRSFLELIKSILKMSLISWIVYFSLKDSVERILGYSGITLSEFVYYLGQDILNVFWFVSLAFLTMAFFDFMYQKYDYIKGLKMTKQEVKDEQKQMEGDPLIKGRIRQIQREMAQRRMMEEVPKADVVITNPTHYSVALQYIPGQMRAPKVIAKGMNHLALRIRELAKEHKVPLVESPSLAQTLYRDVELEQAIPPELFKAVAQVLAYVFSLKKGNAPLSRRMA